MVAEGYVGLPLDAAGKKLHTFILPGGDHVEAVVVVDADGNLVSSPESPQAAVFTSTDLASGASVAFNAPDITTGTLGKLEAVSFAASVPLKCEVYSVGPVVLRDVAFTTDANLTYPWRPPHKDFISLSGGAGKHFRVVLTNQDNADAADVYATIWWDEV